MFCVKRDVDGDVLGWMFCVWREHWSAERRSDALYHNMVCWPSSNRHLHHIFISFKHPSNPHCHQHWVGSKFVLMHFFHHTHLHWLPSLSSSPFEDHDYDHDPHLDHDPHHQPADRQWGGGSITNLRLDVGSSDSSHHTLMPRWSSYRPSWGGWSWLPVHTNVLGCCSFCCCCWWKLWGWYCSWWCR